MRRNISKVTALTIAFVLTFTFSSFAFIQDRYTGPAFGGANDVAEVQASSSTGAPAVASAVSYVSGKPGTKTSGAGYSGDLMSRCNGAGFGALQGGNQNADPTLGIVHDVGYAMADAHANILKDISSRSTEFLFSQDGFSKLYANHTGVGRLYFRTYSKEHGWSPWAVSGEITAGNDDGSRVQAVQIRSKGYIHTMNDIYYKAVLNDGTILDWARNGQTLGAMGNDKYIVALSIKLWDRNKNFPAARSVTMLANDYEGVYSRAGDGFAYSTFDGRAYTGWAFADNTQVYFRDGNRVTGWQAIDGYMYYFNGDGSVCTDLEPVMGLQSAYQIRYNKSTRTMYIMAKDPNGGGFTVPFKTFMSSCGTDTPIGTFSTYAKYDWKFMHPAEDGSGDIYCQKLTRFKDGFLIHSLLYYGAPSPLTLDAINYNYIDDAVSGGCIRLRACDANWVYTNVPLHTPVIIYQDIHNKGPIEKDAINQVIPRSQNYDPTDPTAAQAQNSAEARALAEKAQAAIAAAKADDAAAGITTTE